jgi:hypothetical protein
MTNSFQIPPREVIAKEFEIALLQSGAKVVEVTEGEVILDDVQGPTHDAKIRANGSRSILSEVTADQWGRRLI